MALPYNKSNLTLENNVKEVPPTITPTFLFLLFNETEPRLVLYQIQVGLTNVKDVTVFL